MGKSFAFAGLAILFGCNCWTLFGQAPAVSFVGIQVASSISSSGALPTGLAVDKSGDVFVANTSGGTVVEIPAGGGAPVIVASGLTSPTGVAVDGFGNLFVANTPLSGNGTVVKIPAGGMPVTVASGLTSPTGVAVDGSGNVFIADPSLAYVIEVPAGGGMPVQVGTGLSAPTAVVVVDAADDLFVAVTGGVVKVVGSSQTPVGSGLVTPVGLALDGSGDLFIADAGNRNVVEVPASGGAQVVIPASGLPSVLGVGVDGKGNVFIADTGSPDNQVIKVQQTPSVNFGSVIIGSSSPLTLIYTVNTAITAGGANVVTQGIANLDFTASGSSCVGQLAVPATCTVSASLKPIAPGLRMGAVQLFDSLNNLLTTTLAYGIGVGPQVAFSSAPQISVGTGLVQPGGVAVNAAGDVFITDAPSNLAVEVAPGGSQTTVASGLSGPNSVAVDGAGNVFIADAGNGTVVKVPSGGGLPATVASGLTANGLAVDGAGDLFISANAVLELVNGSSTPTPLAFSGLSGNAGVAVDGSGDVFTADPGQGLVELPAGGSQTSIAGPSTPKSVAVDAAGDVYTADPANSRVVEVPVGCASSACWVTVASSLASPPSNVAVDAAGNVYIAESGSTQVVEVEGSQPPSLSFGAVAIGPPSTAQTVTLQNIGNSPLTFYGIVAPTNFATDPATTSCSTSTPLNPGGVCNGGVVCAPTAVGTLGGMLTLTDNALNASSATQTVNLTCTGQPGAQQITFTTPPPATAAYNSTFTVTATGGASGNPVTFSSDGMVCTNSGATYTMISGTGTCLVTVSQAGNSIYAAAQVTVSVTAALATNTVTFTMNAPTTAAYLTSFTVAASGGGSSNPVIYESYGSCTNLGPTYNMNNGIGPCTVTAFQFGDNNYASGSATETTTAILASQTITFTTNAPASAVYGSTFTVAATGGASGNPVVFTSAGACTNSRAIYTMTSGSGTCSVIANQSGTTPPIYHYAAAPTVTEMTAATLAAQTITFTTKAPASAIYGASFTVAAQASSGLAVIYNSAGACSNVGAVYTMTSGTGTCSVIATQPGNNNYAAATQVAESTTAAMASQGITFTTTPPSSAIYGTSFTVAATASSGLTVTFTSSGSCSNVGSSYTMTSGTGTCSVIANQAGSTNYLAAPQVTKSATAQKATASVSINNIPGNAVAGGSFTPAYTNTGNGTPSATSSTTAICTISGGKVTFKAAGTCTLMASATATSNYLAATGAPQSFTIAPAPTLTSISPSTGVRGTIVPVTLTGTSLTGATAVVVSGTGITVSNVVATSATTVTATFTIAANATVSSRTVSVTTPSGNTNTVTFAVTGPTLTSISPTSGTHGTTVPVVLTGTNLTGATGVTVSGSGITVSGLSVQSSTTVTANFVIASNASLTNRSVSVTTPIGTTGTVTFTVH